jgi:hypothetical protein
MKSNNNIDIVWNSSMIGTWVECSFCIWAGSFYCFVFQIVYCIFFPGLLSDWTSPTYGIPAGMTGWPHNTWLLHWNRVSLTVLPILASIHLSILHSWVAGIIDVSHCDISKHHCLPNKVEWEQKWCNLKGLFGSLTPFPIIITIITIWGLGSKSEWKLVTFLFWS